MQKRVRDPRAGYFQSLDVLRAAKACGVYTKSSIMLGLGETHDEIIDTMYDLKDVVSLPPCMLKLVAHLWSQLGGCLQDLCSFFQHLLDRAEAHRNYRLSTHYTLLKC